VQLWDLVTGENLRTLRSWLVKNPDADVIGLESVERHGTHLLFSGTRDCVSVWDVVSGRCVRNIDISHAGISYPLSCFAVSKDYQGKNIAGSCLLAALRIHFFTLR
jgi:WD40 repeat protein